MRTWTVAAAGSIASIVMACGPFALPAARAADLGRVTAAEACPAYQSIAKKTNPGKVTLVAGRSYAVSAHNKEPPTYVQVMIDGAHPSQRWVAAECVAAGASPAPGPTPSKPTPPAPTKPPGPGMATHLLSLSWEPTFCLSKAAKTECQTETKQSPDAHQLSLHGLWPQPIGNYFCIADPALKRQAIQNDDPKTWGLMPDPHLSPAVRARLAAVMPGVRSKLEFHEWNKHGTCFGGTSDAYFSRAVDLVDQVNHSDVGAFIAANAGKTVTADGIVAAFVKAFGPAATTAVAVSCQGGKISEIDVYLSGNVAGSAPLSALFHKADKHGTCASGQLPLPKT